MAGAQNERDFKLEQAMQFLNGPDFIPVESQVLPNVIGGASAKSSV
jgi:hypothetical protein